MKIRLGSINKPNKNRRLAPKPQRMGDCRLKQKSESLQQFAERITKLKIMDHNNRILGMVYDTYFRYVSCFINKICSFMLEKFETKIKKKADVLRSVY